jgi:hypothetical protein
MEPRQCRDFDAAHALGLSHSQPTDHSLYEFQRRFQGPVKRRAPRRRERDRGTKPGGTEKSRDGQPPVVDISKALKYFPCVPSEPWRSL